MCMGKSSKSWTFKTLILKLAVCPLNIHSSKFKYSDLKLIRQDIKISLIHDFEADFPQKVSLKIMNSGIILKTFTHVCEQKMPQLIIA